VRPRYICYYLFIRMKKNVFLLAMMLAAVPTQARVNVLFGIGVASGNSCLKSPVSKNPSNGEIVGHWVAQIISPDLTFQIEHQFANLVYGLHAHCIYAFND